MDKFIIYSVEIAISLALFYSAYWVFLKNETFFKLNRFYLIFSVAISLLTPLLNITIGRDSFITKNLISPIEQYEQGMFANIDEKNTSLKNGMVPLGGIENIVERKTANANHEIKNSDPEQATPLNSTEGSSSDKKTNWLTLVLVIYFIGVALFLIRFIANFIWIFGYTLRHKQQQILGMKVIRSEKNISPFSFLNLIFISHKEYPEAELSKIIFHEKVHIKQKHSIDLILFELLFVFQWFNPFVWFYKRAIKITHEYLADRGTLDSGIDLPDYQYSLLNQVLRENNFEIASNYNLSIKKRIEMMMKKRSPKLSALKITIAFPILAFLFTAFACTSKDANRDAGEKNESLVATDTILKEVSVPLEYLKMLEGEYVATNDPNRVRKIKFEEVLGMLVGNDAGYRYKIIPQGDGKFINPDDGASLIFDTKDKSAITLLLFGKINLKKVKDSGDFPKKSVAFSLANIMVKDGIPAALSNYKEVRSSDNYDLNENEMNIVGYRLLQSGKSKEALALFKLNTEAFPNSYNVYDSYGHALMALGDKTLALENYKKSVHLNPGSKNGLKVLKEAGIDTDTLIKKVKLPDGYLKLLEGEYHSTNEPNGGVRTVKFMEEEGVLFGNDNGYRYDLIPMGDGKFINPDDGVSIIFDTKDKNTVSVLIFGVLNLKKVGPLKESDKIKKVDVPIEDLKLLEGEYHSTNDKRKITFKLEDGILYGTDNGYRYKIIPTGDGKFTNPDDGAPLVFDTKDKNAITLLLFGTINLKKVK